MSKRADQLYSGASGKTLDLSAAAKLGPDYVLQPKKDGIYSILSFDRKGRLGAAVTRQGQILGPGVMSPYQGIRWVPDSVVTAELELWTERSARLAGARGFAVAHVFDCHRLKGRNLTHDVYSVRRDALMRAESELVNSDDDRPWVEDDHGGCHDPKSGKYTHPTPRSWRRISVVPSLPVAKLDEAWASWVDSDEAEGLVAVAIGAKLGASKSKLKIKQADTLDVVVLDVGPRAAVCFWTAGNRRVVVSKPKSVCLSKGQVIELGYEGFHDSGEPRFCRIVRNRPDLTTTKIVGNSGNDHA